LADRWRYFSWFGLLTVNMNKQLSGRDDKGKLVSFPKLPVLVSPVPGDGEEMNLLSGIEKALSEAGLDVGGGVPHSPTAPSLIGVLICPTNLQDWKAAQLLAEILNRNGVDTRIETGHCPPPAIPISMNILVGSIPPRHQ
jgi:hypothetical protein